MWERAAFVAALLLVALALLQLHLKRSPAGDIPAFARVGDDLGEVLVRSVESETPVNLRSLTEGGCTYVLVFSTRCPWSHVAAEDWAGQVVVPFEDDSFPLVWVSIESDREAVSAFLAEHGILAPVHFATSSRTAWDLGVAFTPSMWILREGRVLSLGERLRRDQLQEPPYECVS